ncbi:RecT family recombinase [Hahella ganghwensis]|uniref:RecT family recombinase n=1 Tax=Hahella ganghwensis TaxID=286420 RepID=UPI0003686DE6|nr:RecT family recombinase [Hahella ganghwensis]
MSAIQEEQASRIATANANAPAINNSADLQTLIFNARAMEELHRLATVMANGSKVTVPEHLQGSVGDCMAICMQAAQWQMNPFAVAQKTHIVNGTLGYEAQLVNAVVSSSKVIRGRFKYEYGGDWTHGANNQSAWVRAGAVLAGETEITWGERLFPAQITTKNSPLWKSNPKQQSAYLATKYWARLYAPDVILGVYSADELSDYVPQGETDITPPSQESTLEAENYPDEQFQANFPKWRDAIEAGKKTPEQIISTVETKGKLTEDQKHQIWSVLDADIIEEEEQEQC